MSNYYIEQFVKENNIQIDNLEKLIIKQNKKKKRKNEIFAYKEKMASFFIGFTQFMTYFMAPILIIVAIFSSGFTLLNALSIYILSLVPTIAININVLRSIIKKVEIDNKMELLEKTVTIRISLNNYLKNINSKDLTIIRNNLNYVLKMSINPNSKTDTKHLSFLDEKLILIIDNAVKCSKDDKYEESQIYTFIEELYKKENKFVKKIGTIPNKH